VGKLVGSQEGLCSMELWS